MFILQIFEKGILVCYRKVSCLKNKQFCYNLRLLHYSINFIYNNIFIVILDVLSNMDMFDLENDLPDELMSSGGSWGMVSDPMGNNKPPAQGPGPGMQNGVENSDNANNLRQQMQLSHHLLQQVKQII